MSNMVLRFIGNEYSIPNDVLIYNDMLSLMIQLKD